jgi:hypothetical protein
MGAAEVQQHAIVAGHGHDLHAGDDWGFVGVWRSHRVWESLSYCFYTGHRAGADVDRHHTS